MSASTRYVDITLHMPAEWADHFWDWWVNGDGEYEFTEGLDKEDCEKRIEWAHYDKARRLILFAKEEATLQAMKRLHPKENPE